VDLHLVVHNVFVKFRPESAVLAVFVGGLYQTIAAIILSIDADRDAPVGREDKPAAIIHLNLLDAFWVENTSFTRDEVFQAPKDLASICRANFVHRQ
jgi:hypothetical protein